MLPCTAVAGDSFSISGTLISAADGSPLPQCQLSIQPSVSFRVQANELSKPTTVVSGGDGRFEFSKILRGKYALIAQCNGYRTQAIDQHDGFSSAVAVGPDKESRNIVFRMQPS